MPSRLLRSLHRLVVPLACAVERGAMNLRYPLWRQVILVWCVVAIAPHANGHASDVGNTSADTPSARVAATLGRLPLAFEPIGHEARGSESRFIARAFGYRVFLAPADIRLLVDRRPLVARDGSGGVVGDFNLHFVNGNGGAEPQSIEALPARTHYFHGRSDQHRLDVPTFTRVRFRDVYRGVDVDYYGKNGQLEFDLIVRPGADVSAVRLAAVGGEPALEASGDVRIGTGEASLLLHRPVGYQIVDGARRLVETEFTLLAGNEIGIAVGAYDPTELLIIDPTLAYASYFGGKGLDEGTAIAVDAAGNLYIAGVSGSSDLPMVNAYDRTLGKGDTDVFVAKINAAGTALIYSTYIGGGVGTERAAGIGVDKSGNVYVTGNTSGSDFPTTGGAYQSGVAGGGAFVAKLGPSGNTLVYSTYVRSATAKAIAVDADGNAYVTGSAVSGFATTPGVFQAASGNAAGSNAFVLKLNAAGTAALYATFLGGSGNDIANGIAVDASGNAYVGGGTMSSNFPVQSALQPTAGGAREGFIAKLNPTGTALRFSTYLGGTQDDAVNAIGIDTADNVYVAGETYSGNFPVKDAYQPRKSGVRLLNSSLGNAFFAKIAADGGALVYSSFLGGEICTTLCQPVFGTPQFAGDAAYAIAVDAHGDAYVGGLAKTYQFPLVDSLLPQKTDDNFTSSFVAKIGRGGGLLYSTFVRSSYGFGGVVNSDIPADSIAAIAIDATGAAYVIGTIDEPAVFQPTASTLQRTFGGFYDATIFKLSGSAATIDLASSANPIDAQQALTFTATITGATFTGAIEFRDGPNGIGSAPISNGKAILTVPLLPGVYALSAVYIGNGVNVDSPVLYQVVDNPLNCN